jgi:NAD(P)-dependent dehydrogenase (short-subunit alcohol dehydrogenase family)
VKKFAQDNTVDLRPIELDVSSGKSIDPAIRRIVAETGQARRSRAQCRAYGVRPGEAFTPKLVAKLYDINVLSTQMVNRAALSGLKSKTTLGVDRSMAELEECRLEWPWISIRTSGGWD